MFFPRLMLLTCAMMWRLSRCLATVEDHLVGRYQLRHGDPCGQTDDPTLVCCPGAANSTLIYLTEECCNGRPVGLGELCCDWTLPVPRASPTHDACCRDPGTGHALTYDSHLSYCDRNSWEIRENSPQLENFLMKIFADSADYLSNVVPEQSVPLLCGPGADDNRSVGPRWHGENMACCGFQSYYPSQQTCCAAFLHDIPSEHSLCCGQQAYSKNDLTNPCLATCGDNRFSFNRETDLCCNGVVHHSVPESHVCCGTDLINGETHGCCRDRLPYVRHLMKCVRRGELERKRDSEFRTRKLCNQRLPTWRDGWPEPVLDSDLLHIQGQVSNVTINRSRTRAHVKLTMHPFRVIRLPDAANDTSLMTSVRVHILVLLDSSRCHSETELSDYLSRKTFTLFSDMNSLNEENGVPVITVPSRSDAHLMMLHGVESW